MFDTERALAFGSAGWADLMAPAALILAKQGQLPARFLGIDCWKGCCSSMPLSAAYGLPWSIPRPFKGKIFYE